MTVFAHVVHTIRPIGGDVFDRWVDFYANVSMPAMERNGFDVLGAWKLSTGRLQQDLLLARFESLGAYEKATDSLMADKELGKGIAAAFSSGMEIEEHVTFARPVSYAEERFIEAALSEKPDKPRQYLLATLPARLGQQGKAIKIIGELVERLNKGKAMNLITAYESISGERGVLNDLWVLPSGMHDLSYRPHNPGLDDLLGPLREAAPEETFTFMNPLPYSPLQ